MLRARMPIFRHSRLFGRGGRRNRRERPHEIGGERENALEDIWGDFLGLGVGFADHFEFGVEIVDVMQGEGLGSAGSTGEPNSYSP